MSFGKASLAEPDTAWVLRRTANMIDYAEIYRYVGPTGNETIGADVTAYQIANRIVVTDGNPPTGPVFYQFVAESVE